MTFRPLHVTRIEPRDPAAGAITSQRGVWQNPLLNVLAGADRFFGLAGHPNYDQPNPRGPVGVIDLRTWTQAPSLALTTSNPAPPFINCDWPVPRGAQPGIVLKTWTDPLKLNLLGSFQPTSFDWTNPPRSAFSIDLRTWTQSTPNLLTTTNPAPPFINCDWPVPRGAQPGVTLKTWIDATKVNLLGKDQFFGAAGQPPANLDWPNPRGAMPASDLRTWITRTALSLFVTDAAPNIDPSLTRRNQVKRRRILINSTRD